jgi:hypothetical protein
MSPDQASDSQAQMMLWGFLATWLLFLVWAFWFQHQRAKRKQAEWNYRQSLMRQTVKRAP